MRLRDEAGGEELEERKVKVTIPGELYVKLHGRKLLDGTLIREQVTEALEAYFDSGEGEE